MDNQQRSFLYEKNVQRLSRNRVEYKRIRNGVLLNNKDEDIV